MQADDLDAFFRIMSDARVVSQTSWPLCDSREAARDVMEKMNAKLTAKNSIYWGIVRKDQGELIGYVGLTNFLTSESRAGTTFAVAFEHWGRGYGTEAVERAIRYGFGEVGLNRIQAFVFTGNEPSKKVLVKSGFQYEGLLRSYFHDHRGFHDLELYAVLAGDQR